MPTNPQGGSANYTSQWQAIEMLIFRIDRIGLSWGCVEVKCI